VKSGSDLNGGGVGVGISDRGFQIPNPKYKNTLKLKSQIYFFVY
jgi:hypothetical protein